MIDIYLQEVEEYVKQQVDILFNDKYHKGLIVFAFFMVVMPIIGYICLFFNKIRYKLNE